MRKHKIIKIDRKILLINSNLSRLKRFSRNKHNKNKFFEYMFIDYGRILDFLGKEPPHMTNREELIVDKARDKWLKLIAKG